MDGGRAAVLAMLLTLAVCEALLCLGHCQRAAGQPAVPHHGAHQHHGAPDAPAQPAAPHAACAHHSAAGETPGTLPGEPRIAAISVLALLAALALCTRAAAPAAARAESLALPPPLRPPIPAAR